MTIIDLSLLPPPDVIDEIDYDTIFRELTASLTALMPELAATLQLDSEPLTKLLQMAAYRELLLRQRINNAAQAVMLAYASGTDLDHIGALFKVKRLTISPGNPAAIPPVPPQHEQDDDFRKRIQLSLDGLSVAGPARAYIYHALSASGQVLDASADAPRFSLATISASVRQQLPANSIVLIVDYDAGLSHPQPGDVVVTVLSRQGNGTPTDDVLAQVETALDTDDIRPLTDNPHVRPAAVQSYSLAAKLYSYAGPDPSVILQTAQQNATAYVQENHRLGRSVTRSGLYAALHVAGVQRVDLDSPTADITCQPYQAAYCTDISITYGGIAS